MVQRYSPVRRNTIVSGPLVDSWRSCSQWGWEPSRKWAENSELESMVFEQHPVFDVYNIPDSPFDDVIQMSRWFRVTENWERNDGRRADGVRTLARTSASGDPVIFEHQVGAGARVDVSDGRRRRWSNWPIAPAAPGYVVMHLLIHPYLQKPSDLIQQYED